MELREVVELECFSFRRVDTRPHLYADGSDPGEMTEEKVETAGRNHFDVKRSRIQSPLGEPALVYSSSPLYIVRREERGWESS